MLAVPDKFCSWLWLFLICPCSLVTLLFLEVQFHISGVVVAVALMATNLGTGKIQTLCTAAVWITPWNIDKILHCATTAPHEKSHASVFSLFPFLETYEKSHVSVFSLFPFFLSLLKYCTANTDTQLCRWELETWSVWLLAVLVCHWFPLSWTGQISLVVVTVINFEQWQQTWGSWQNCLASIF